MLRVKFAGLNEHNHSSLEWVVGTFTAVILGTVCEYTVLLFQIRANLS